MEEEYKKCLAIIINNLEPDHGFDCRPLANSLALQIADYARLVLGGMTCEEASLHMEGK